MKHSKEIAVPGLGKLVAEYDFIPGSPGFTDPDDTSRDVPAVEDELHVTWLYLELLNGTKLAIIHTRGAESIDLNELFYKIHCESDKAEAVANHEVTDRGWHNPWV